MKPILYVTIEKDFNNNGLGHLSEAISSLTAEVANGEYTNETIYPANGRLAKSITEGMLLKVKPNDLDEPHVFEIQDYVLDTVEDTITIYSSTITNRLGRNLVKHVTVNNLDGQQTMNLLKGNLIEPTDFDFISDITTRSSTEWKNRNPLNCIAGEEGSLLQYWGGEIKRDNRTIYLYKRRGRDNVAVIREGKHIQGLSLEYSLKGLVTKIVPYRTYTPENSDDEVTEYGNVVVSQYANRYPISYIEPVDYSHDEDVTNLATMNAKAAKYFSENSGIDEPRFNVSLDMVELSKSSEYKDKFKGFETIGLFDTVTVYSKRYNLVLTAKVNKVVYDSIAERNITVEMGNFKTGLIESVESEYKELIRETEIRNQNIIQRAANGKNRIFRGVDEPTKGMVKNDLWYQPVGAGETMLYRFDGAYWQIEKVSAGLLGGTLDAESGDLDLINVNVSKLVGDTSEFVRSAWNGIASRITIDGDEILTIDVSGRYVTLSNGGMSFGGGGEEIVLRNNTGENPNRSGISLNPVRSDMNSVDFDINTRGNSALHMGTSDLDLGYRLRLANEEQNKNNYYISLKTGKRFSFDLDRTGAGTGAKNTLELEVMDASGTMRVGRSPQYGSSMWLVNDDVIFAKGGTNNRVSVFAGRFAGQAFNYIEADKIYSIEKTISSILGWIGKDGQWVQG